MPTYEYECAKCGLRFERRQSIKDEPIADCPECGGKVHRIISGGAGFIMKRDGPRTGRQSGNGCSMEEKGRTCCGRDERCARPPCEEK